VERLERHVLNERQCALLARLGGDKRAQLPVFETERGKLDRLLEAQPERQYTQEQRDMIAALGLGG
jgi:hypothetical protein